MLILLLMGRFCAGVAKNPLQSASSLWFSILKHGGEYKIGVVRPYSSRAYAALGGMWPTSVPGAAALRRRLPAAGSVDGPDFHFAATISVATGRTWVDDWPSGNRQEVCIHRRNGSLPHQLRRRTECRNRVDA